MSSGLSIRAHLAILVLATALPLIGLVAYGAYAQAALDAVQANEQALRAARSAVVEAERTLLRTRDLLAYLSRQPLVNALDRERCDPIFGEFNGLFPDYTNLLTVRRDGDRICSAVTPPAGAPAKVGPTLYLAETLRSGVFTVGQVNRGIFTGRWIVIVAHPLAKVSGEIPGIVAMAIDLARLRFTPTAGALPPGAQARIVDGEGTVIASSGGAADKGLGQSLADVSWRNLLKPGQVASGQARDTDGTERFFGAVPVAGTNWHAVVGIPVDVVYAPARARAVLGACVTVFVLLLVAVLAYLLARGTARPIEAIAAAARRATNASVPSDKATVVADLATAPTEVRQLADNFVEMLDTRAAAEQALRGSEERYRLIVETAQEGIWQIDAQNNTVFANAKMAQILGTTVDQMIGASLFDFMEDDGQAAAQASVERHRQGLVDQHEFRYRRKDGNPVWVLINGNPLRDSAGRYVGALAMVTDITERRRVEQSLKETEAQLHAADRTLADIVHGMNEACFALDAQWRFTFVNDRVEGLLRRRPEDLLHRTIWETFPHIVGTPVEDHYRRVMALREPAAVEVLSAFFGRWLDIRLFPSGDGLAAFLMDIHPRKMAEAQVQELNLALERRVQERTAQLASKSAELESFCYSVSHDLKAPLRGIDGYSRLLMEDYSGILGEEGCKFIVNVRSATQHMTALIEDLLAYSRQERRTLVAARIDLRRFVADQLAKQGLGLEGVDLVVEIDDVRVAADPESLAIALRNLVDNARKFSAHAARPAITLRSRSTDGRCVLSVQDNGSGFDMRYHDKIFEIFQRLHRAEDYPGTGVGLALVRKAMDRMGGRVWAHSAPGAGATFYLDLELLDAHAASAYPSA